MNTNWDNKRKLITVLYFLGIAAILFITLIISSTKQGHIENLETYISISNAWTLD